MLTFISDKIIVKIFIFAKYSLLELVNSRTALWISLVRPLGDWWCGCNVNNRQLARRDDLYTLDTVLTRLNITDENSQQAAA